MTDENYTPEHRAGDDYGYSDSVVGRLNPMFSDSTYNRLKFLAQILLPAVGTLYFAWSQIWGLPAGEQVVGTIVSFDTFLGVILGVSSASYRNETEGALVGFADVVTDENGNQRVVLNFPGDPEDVPKQDKITFKVRHIS